jgi:hypothetical protein
MTENPYRLARENKARKARRDAQDGPLKCGANRFSSSRVLRIFIAADHPYARRQDIGKALARPPCVALVLDPKRSKHPGAQIGETRQFLRVELTSGDKRRLKAFILQCEQSRIAD